jgi:hypothetical protein
VSQKFNSPTEAMVAECLIQSGNHVYTSAMFYIWLRTLRKIRTAFIVVPLILGSVATWTLLTQSQSQEVRVAVAVAAFIAGLLPTVYRALKFDDNIKTCETLAAEFKGLQDAFRQCATISSLKPFDEFEADFKATMNRLEAARRPSYTPPEWCFKEAQRKVKAGDYTPDEKV